MSLFEMFPHTGSVLEEWRAAVGKPSVAQLIEIGVKHHAEKIRDTVSGWKAGTVSTWLQGAISARDNAVAMIACLREAAQRGGYRLFSDELLASQAAIFMRSAACREGGFTPLSGEELAMIAASPIPEIDPRFDDLDLLRKVFPPPPVRPFGRESELREIIDAISTSLISVIVSDPGNGKTTLAWHAGRRAVAGGLMMGMDWNTDKRSMITASGEERPINLTGVPLGFDTVISSAYRRFGWHDFDRVPRSHLTALVAKRLTEGRYLLVVDNLETVPQADRMVTDLRGLLEPRGELAQLGSRVLITSRVAVQDVPGVRHVNVGGLELEPTTAFIRTLEADNDYPVRLSESQIEQLWINSKGNPLLMQIALTRIAQQGVPFREVLHDLDSGTGFMIVFDRLFGPLIDSLTRNTPRAAFLATYAALLQEQRLEDLRTAWRREYDDDENAFQEALSAVIRAGVLRPVPATTGEYAIHPMVRLYLRHQA